MLDRKHAFWQRLEKVTQCTRIIKSRGQEEWKGRAEVRVTNLSETVILFHERGVWQIKDEEEINFTNTFRWTFDLSRALISLEHLRRGADQPVFLVHLIPTKDKLLNSVESHQCKEDLYLATVFWDDHAILLNWQITGPKKNETIECCYQ